MSSRKPSVVVAGDAAVDWFHFPVSGNDTGPNWRLHPATYAAALPGGVFLLAEMLQAAFATNGEAASISAPFPPVDLRRTSPEELLHSNATLESYDGGKSLRVREALGFIGPSGGAAPSHPFASDETRGDVVLLDDAGNGFRDDSSAWPNSLSSDARPSLVIHKLHRPLHESPLSKLLVQRHRDRYVAVVRAEDVRRIAGVDVSCALSWERTAKDFLFQMQRAQALERLRWQSYLIVLFGADGAIVYYGSEKPEARLIFDPKSLEGGFAASVRGRVHGQGSAFAAALTARLTSDGIGSLERGVAEGLAATRNLIRAGLRRDGDTVSYPLKEVFSSSGLDDFRSSGLPPADSLSQADPRFWRLLDQRTRSTRAVVAEEIVVDGRSEGLGAVPLGVFGKLRTIDRAEIESYSAIRGLIQEYLLNPKPDRPLSFAVFGPPGAGKSFGVKQVVASLGSTDLQTVTFNISQFENYRDLVAAFHEVRNIGLRGQTPFVFFDEFDAASEEGPLAWLKSFLAPMQDGEFKEGGAVHPIGKAIFVFAGGTRSTYEEFSGGCDGTDEAAVAFRAAKGPDFVSRLRGFINVMGPNPQGAADSAFLIRRAMVLRSMLDRNPKARGMFDSRKRLRIDEGVLRALLHIGRYRHGTRSMEALLDMSHLTGRDRFDLAALPPADQLQLHVDAQEFGFLARQERFLSSLNGSGSLTFLDEFRQGGESRVDAELALVDRAAQKIHDDYLQQRRLEGKAERLPSWAELSDEKKRSNREAAADIPRKLRAVGCGLRPFEGSVARTPDLTDKEIERLARMEHARWCAEQRLQGFSCGAERDLVRKTSPYLVPYDDLSAEIQAYDVQAVLHVPAILQSLGLELYRMEESDSIEDQELVERLARLIHAAYVEERTKEGDSLDRNPAMAEFDALPGDLRAANYDNAASVPRKLKRLGVELERVQPGVEPRPLALSDEQIEQLAEMEHSRWMWQKLLQGWTYAPGVKDVERRTSPDLVSWAKLPDDRKMLDRQTVRLIPRLLKAAGYQLS